MKLKRRLPLALIAAGTLSACGTIPAIIDTNGAIDVLSARGTGQTTVILGHSANQTNFSGQPVNNQGVRRGQAVYLHSDNPANKIIRSAWQYDKAGEVKYVDDNGRTQTQASNRSRAEFVFDDEGMDLDACFFVSHSTNPLAHPLYLKGGLLSAKRQVGWRISRKNPVDDDGVTLAQLEARLNGFENERAAAERSLANSSELENGVCVLPANTSPRPANPYPSEYLAHKKYIGQALCALHEPNGLRRGAGVGYVESSVTGVKRFTYNVKSFQAAVDYVKGNNIQAKAIGYGDTVKSAFAGSFDASASDLEASFLKAHAQCSKSVDQKVERGVGEYESSLSRWERVPADRQAACEDKLELVTNFDAKKQSLTADIELKKEQQKKPTLLQRVGGFAGDSTGLAPISGSACIPTIHGG